MYGDNQGFRGPRRSFAPVKVGDEFDVKIEVVGEKGDGIAKKNGFVLFIPNTKEGDEVKVKVTKVLRKFGFAEVAGTSTGSDSQDSEAEPSGEEPAQEKAEETEETEEAPQEADSETKDTEDFGEETSEESENAEDSGEESSEEKKE